MVPLVIDIAADPRIARRQAQSARLLFKRLLLEIAADDRPCRLDGCHGMPRWAGRRPGPVTIKAALVPSLAAAQIHTQLKAEIRESGSGEPAAVLINAKSLQGANLAGFFVGESAGELSGGMTLHH